MTWKNGVWGKEARERSKKRLAYFLKYQKGHYSRHFKGFGSLGELIALKLLSGSVLVRKKQFDVEWQRKKVEVKIARLNCQGRWAFHTERQTKPDYYFLVCAFENEIINMYLIPKSEIKIKSVSISPRTMDKYGKFLVGNGVRKNG